MVRSIGIDRDERALEAFGCDYPVELVHGCAHSFLASFPFLGPELVYSNPPYLHATRRPSKQRYTPPAITTFHFEAHHRALAARRGYKRAIVAGAHKMLRIIYVVLKNGRPY